MAQAYNPRTSGGQGGWIFSKDGLVNTVFTENTKISWAWWHTPVVPATWEAEAGESLEPGRQKSQWAEIAALHSSLGDKSKTPSQKKKKIKKIIKRKEKEASKMVHVCSPNCYPGGWGGRIPWTQELEASLSNIVRPCLLTSKKNRGTVADCEPVVWS